MRLTDPRSGRIFERVSPYRAILPLLFFHEHYLQLAIQHNMAINLESRGTLEAFQEGAYPKEGWEPEALAKAKDAAAHVRRGIWSSFLLVAAIAVLAVVLAHCLGKLSHDLPLSWPKLLGMFGGFLTVWATLMELGGFIKTYSGEALHELVHPALFKVLFLPGSLVAMVGLLW